MSELGLVETWVSDSEIEFFSNVNLFLSDCTLSETTEGLGDIDCLIVEEPVVWGNNLVITKGLLIIVSLALVGGMLIDCLVK